MTAAYVVEPARPNELAVAFRFVFGHLPEHERDRCITNALRLVAEGEVDRAGILASANDLVAAAGAVLPGLVPFRRALVRTLGRPVGQSGSGPAMWALYASPEAALEAADLVRAAIADGRCPVPGTGDATIIATSIAPSITLSTTPSIAITTRIMEDA